MAIAAVFGLLLVGLRMVAAQNATSGGYATATPTSSGSTAFVTSVKLSVEGTSKRTHVLCTQNIVQIFFLLLKPAHLT